MIMYTGLSGSKLMEQLNGNILYQIFCDMIVDSAKSLTNYKLLDEVMLELAGKLRIQQLQGNLAEKWRPYTQNLDTIYSDATCYESEIRKTERANDKTESLLTSREKGDLEIITRVYR